MVVDQPESECLVGLFIEVGREGLGLVPDLSCIEDRKLVKGFRILRSRKEEIWYYTWSEVTKLWCSTIDQSDEVFFFITHELTETLIHPWIGLYLICVVLIDKDVFELSMETNDRWERHIVSLIDSSQRLYVIIAAESRYFFVEIFGDGDIIGSASSGRLHRPYGIVFFDTTPDESEDVLHSLHVTLLCCGAIDDLMTADRIEFDIFT